MSDFDLPSFNGDSDTRLRMERRPRRRTTSGMGNDFSDTLNVPTRPARRRSTSEDYDYDYSDDYTEPYTNRRSTTRGTGNNGSNGGRRSTLPQKHKPKKKNHLGLKIFSFVMLVVFIIGVIGCGIVGYEIHRISADMPDWDPGKLMSNSNSLMYANNGMEIYELYGTENRHEVTLDQVPQDMINALLATEDRNFYSHHGIDIKGIIRSMFINLTSGDLTQGASTITQQLARQSFLTLDKTWERKVKEIILAFKIESNYSKDEILTFYLNKMCFGAGAYGVQAAANTYFGKDVSELNLAQSAMIIGLLQAPTAYNPLVHFDRAQERQHIVLQNMVNAGYISQEQADEAKATDVQLTQNTVALDEVDTTKNEFAVTYGYYIDAAIEEATDILSQLGYADPETAVYNSGLAIYTNLDPNIQNRMNVVYDDTSLFPSLTYDGNIMQSASVVVENSTGRVVALTGGRSYETVRGFNRATQAKRQPGSCIKPLTVYGPALDTGIMPVQGFDDSRISYKQADGSSWSPENYDGTYRGYISMRTALQYSINTYAVQLLDKVGIDTAYNYGISLGLPLQESDKALAPLALGGLTEGVTPMQMAGAYACLGNYGNYNKPYLISQIYDSDGVLIYSHPENPNQVFTEETAWLLTDMLQTVTSAGTGTTAKVPGVPTAGKTGTSEEKSNAWFCGYTPKYACSVWFGFDTVHAMPTVYGSDAGKVFKQIMIAANENIDPGSFDDRKPNDIVRISADGFTDYAVEGYEPSGSYEYDDNDENESDSNTVSICTITGLLAGPYCPAETVSLPANEIPNSTCTSCNEDTMANTFNNTDPFAGVNEGETPADENEGTDNGGDNPPPADTNTDNGGGDANDFASEDPFADTVDSPEVVDDSSSGQ